MSKKVYILGAGYAGIEAALTLQKRKKKSDDIEIFVIDRNSNHTLFQLLHEVAGNRIAEKNASVPLHEIFQYTDINFIKDEIKSIDFKSNKLISEATEYNYDFLILSAGNCPDSHDVTGVSENSFALSSVEDAVKLREHIKDCFAQAIIEKDSRQRRALLTFVIGGGGFTGIETAGELANWIGELCKEYEIDREDTKIVIAEANSSILSDLGEQNLNKAAAYLVKKKMIDLIEGQEIIEADAGLVKLKSGQEIPAQTLIWSAGLKGADLVKNLDILKGSNDRINADEFTATQYSNVFAAGGIAVLKAGYREFPTRIEFAKQTGRRAARNILAGIRGKEKDIVNPHIFGFAITIGSFFGISKFCGFRLPSFLAVLLKYLMNIKYLFRIGGFELAGRYIKEELLFKKQEKFLLEKHYSRSSLSLWFVPIRLFLGYAWLMEGVNKIGEGWLNKAMLAGSAVDGATSASVSESGEKVFRIVAGHTPGWYAWIADNLVVPHALIFQVMIVAAEIGLGLAFLSGAFTFIAGLVALGLNINFMLSTGLLPETWWMIPAAIAVMGGAGRAFGVDYYLMPYLMRQWRYFTRNWRVKPFLFR